MKTTYKILQIILVIAVGVLLLLYVRSCESTQQVKVIRKTIKHHISRNNPEPDSIIFDTLIQYKTKHLKDTIFIYDTIYIIKDVVNDYFAKVHYPDTLLDDSIGLITVSDTIFMNRLLSRESNIYIYSKTYEIRPIFNM